MAAMKLGQLPPERPLLMSGWLLAAWPGKFAELAGFAGRRIRRRVSSTLHAHDSSADELINEFIHAFIHSFFHAVVH